MNAYGSQNTAEAPPTPILEIKGLSVRRSKGGQTFQLHLKDTLRIDSGDFVTVVGRNGCGKSTLLDVLGLVLKPEGTERFTVHPKSQKGVDLSGSYWSERKAGRLRKRHLGYILQSGGLLPFLSVQGNAALSCLLGGLSVRKRVPPLLQELGITRIRHKKPGTLSGGERQRTAIARALAHGPTLILADEPTAAVDQETAYIILEHLKKLVADGSAVIMVTHDPTLAEQAKPTKKVTFEIIASEKTEAGVPKKIDSYVKIEDCRKQAASQAFPSESQDTSSQENPESDDQGDADRKIEKQEGKIAPAARETVVVHSTSGEEWRDTGKTDDGQISKPRVPNLAPQDEPKQDQIRPKASTEDRNDDSREVTPSSFVSTTLPPPSGTVESPSHQVLGVSADFYESSGSLRINILFWSRASDPRFDRPSVLYEDGSLHPIPLRPTEICHCLAPNGTTLSLLQLTSGKIINQEKLLNPRCRLIIQFTVLGPSGGALVEEKTALRILQHECLIGFTSLKFEHPNTFVVTARTRAGERGWFWKQDPPDQPLVPIENEHSVQFSSGNPEGVKIEALKTPHGDVTAIYLPVGKLI